MKKKQVTKKEKSMPGRNGSWDNTAFAIKVKKKLIDKNMTQRQLADILGVSPAYVCQNIYGHKNDEVLRERIKEILGIKERKIASGE